MIRRAVLAGLIAFSLIGYFTPQTVAQSEDEAVYGPLTVDCASMDEWTQDGKDWAIENGYCSGGSVAPANIVIGNCGHTGLFLYDFGNGTAYADMSAYSTIGGGMNSISWNLGMTNWTTGAGFNYGATEYVGGNTYWSWSQYAYTRPGYVTGAMSAKVWLVSGISCTGLVPSDSVTVS